MREPERFPRVVPPPAEVPTVDLRPWSQKNATAIGTIIGTALSVFLVGTGGLTGLAHVAGIALSKDLDPLRADIATVVAAQQKAPTQTGIDTAFKAVNAKLDAISRENKALRGALAGRSKKKQPEPQDGGTGG